METPHDRHGRSAIAISRPGKIERSHLARQAIVYVRQSTLRQVHQHQESGRLQYALRDQAVAWGWPSAQVEIIDEDQGQSGASAERRSGFQRLVAEVGLKHVGLVLGIEISRLARSNADWYQLLDMCALSHTLIADTDGLYDPRQYNDRLVLGLKGTMSEAELHILRQRLDAGRWAKARRGELYIVLPMGYVYRPSGEIIKDPDEQVQSVIDLIFTTFERCRTIRGVARDLLTSGVQLPVRARSGPDRGMLRWSRPRARTLRKLFASPIYAGAYVYGRKASRALVAPAEQPGPSVEQLEDRWEVCLKDRLPAYITWEEFARNVRQIQANHPARRGTPRQGASLLAGLVVCGHCGTRMGTRYSHNGRGLRYCCEPGRPLPQETPCHSVPGTLIDEAVTRLVLDALEPMAVEVSVRAAEDLEAERTHFQTYWAQRLERARYEATRAFRQYNATEPEHRLVARQLEQQWETALQTEADLRAEYERLAAQQPVPLSAQEQETIRRVAQDIPALWQAPSTSTADRQALVRQLVDQVTVTLQGNSEQMQVQVHWAGGHRTSLSLIRPVASLHQLSYYPALIQRAIALRKAGHEVSAMAQCLTEEGWRPRQGAGPWTDAKVNRLLEQPEAKSLKQARTPLSQGIPKEAHEWTTRELAQELGMARDSLHNWVQKGQVRGRKLTYHGRSLWLLWADTAELARLRKRRNCPHYGTHPPRIDLEELTRPKEPEKHEKISNSACQNSAQAVGRELEVRLERPEQAELS
jgi:DNA invertase Pin-like site-specific DNA recombinase